MDLIAQLARELNLKAANIEAAVKLIDEGNTIPFYLALPQGSHGRHGRRRPAHTRRAPVLPAQS